MTSKTIKNHKRRSQLSASKIQTINGTLPRNCVFNITSVEQEGAAFHGFIRVQMNLIRPVEMEVPTQPPTLYDVLNHNPDNPDTTAATADNRPQPTTDNAQTTFFYLPKDTSKVIHINSDTTTKEVIKTLLSKFKIKDNPMKFALYHKQGTDDDSASMRRLNEEELPLPMCLVWTDDGIEGLTRNKFVLQENDTGEILWDAFSLPELENFLFFLNREEDEYVKELKSTYRLLKVQLQKRLEELRRD